MRIHLTDASKDRGQYGVLSEERCVCHLVSFAYRHSALRYYEQTWEKMVRIHLATTTDRLKGVSVTDFIFEEKKSECLFSYAYRKQEDLWKNTWEMNMDDLRPRVLIDSGAFTAWSSGKEIAPEEYAEWATDFDSRWRDRMKSLHFMNLDVIGDQEKSWENQRELERLGMRPIPIVTYGADVADLERALDGYEYIALGGLVPHAFDRPKLRAWLDYSFSRIVPRFKKTGAMPKVHLLGVSSDWALNRYPCYSSDSSSWVSCLRYGEGKAAGLKRVPRYTGSDEALKTTIHAIRAEVRRYKKLEEDATRLWASRGVSWKE